MSTHKEYALIAILATAAVIGILPAFAQSAADSSQISSGPGSQQILPITVSTDKGVYDRQSTVIVTGHVLNAIGGETVTMKVSDPSGNVVQVNQLTLSSNGDYEAKINTSSPLWSAGGTYTIYVQAGAQQGLLSTTTQFTVSGGVETTSATSCTPQQLSITVDANLYCIDYSINGGTVSGITADHTSKSLVVAIQATNDGSITLNIPRSVLDAKSGTTDSSFVVLLDGEQTLQFTDSPTTDTRNITIPFHAESEKIEIIGTQVVPEFGPIAALVLAIAIISIIAVSAKTGLRFMPKY
jgi:predicted secreted protein with PEFG-CTERM motif